MQRIQVKDYFIAIGDIWDDFRNFLRERRYPKVCVLVDEHTRAHCLPIFEKNLPDLKYQLIEVTAGEKYKTIQTCTGIWQKMLELNINRNGLLINLGGGVIGDMGGFAAGSYKRGIDFLQMPTTVLAQVDASIGGKLGIDFGGVKNSVGLFQNPQAVYIYPAFLKTLSFREKRSGFAEILKHALIADKDQWDLLKQETDLTLIDWVSFLEPSLLIKRQIVEEDPWEKGVRKALNFGHTIGHAIEAKALKEGQSLLHGEAIAIGMISEAWLSHSLGFLTIEALNEVVRYLGAVYPLRKIEESDFSDYLRLMQKDKKNESNQINFTFLEEIGSARIDQTAEPGEIIKALNFYNEVRSS